MKLMLIAAVSSLAILCSSSIAGRAEIPVVPNSARGGIPTLAPMLKKVLPGVVGIAIDWSGSGAEQERNPVHDDSRTYFNVPDHPDGRLYPAASGVIINAHNGLIVTSNHMVEHAPAIEVTLSDGHQLVARLIGGDTATDIALLKVSTDTLTEIPFAHTQNLEVGDFVVAIGNPTGIAPSITTGVVGGLHRQISNTQKDVQFIQTDVTMDPGNLGGALVDLRGNLVGLDVDIDAADKHGDRVGYAIPADTVRRIARRLAKAPL